MVYDNDPLSTGQTHVSYLKNALQDREHHIMVAVNRINKLRRSGLDFDAIAFMGLSGSLMGSAIADKLGVGMMAVRKQNEDRHSQWASERTPGCSTYIIVDDVVATGSTVRHIMHTLGQQGCQGIYLYADSSEQCMGRSGIEQYAKCLNEERSNID